MTRWPDHASWGWDVLHRLSLLPGPGLRLVPDGTNPGVFTFGTAKAAVLYQSTAFLVVMHGWGLTQLSVRLIEQGIRLLYGRVCHPRTQGKVERFQYRTMAAVSSQCGPTWKTQKLQGPCRTAQTFGGRRGPFSFGLRMAR